MRCFFHFSSPHRQSVLGARAFFCRSCGDRSTVLFFGPRGTTDCDSSVSCWPGSRLSLSARCSCCLGSIELKCAQASTERIEYVYLVSVHCFIYEISLTKLKVDVNGIDNRATEPRFNAVTGTRTNREASWTTASQRWCDRVLRLKRCMAKVWCGRYSLLLGYNRQPIGTWWPQQEKERERESTQVSTYAGLEYITWIKYGKERNLDRPGRRRNQTQLLLMGSYLLGCLAED